ncbi:MAG: hypothetical protein C4576_15870 [Desulfobacteraceae bacterium]|nr:MAG: hypothetical protein C4576_15870 [Desulfobacteraceae bacterium]
MSDVKCPMNKKGERNPFCPYYHQCLDEAAKKLWSSLDCSQCEYRTSQESRADITDYLSGDSMQIHDLPSGMDDQF